MPPKFRAPLIVIAANSVLAAAAFVAFSLLNPNPPGFSRLPRPGATTGADDQKTGLTYDVIPATEMPAGNPDLAGQLEQRQDNSLLVRLDSKGAPAPLVEVVITGQTRLYRNATDDFVGTPPAAGAAVQMVLAPVSLEQVAAGERVIAWGEQRGDRLVAEVIMVEGAPASPAP